MARVLIPLPDTDFDPTEVGGALAPAARGRARVGFATESGACRAAIRCC
jgi:hypothetical protein